MSYLPIGIEALENTNWKDLHHAYGRATDTPDHLRSLLSNDARAQKAAFGHLWSAVLHQGTAWTATAPVALVIVGILPELRDKDDDSVRAGLVAFLAEVADVPNQSGLSMDELDQMAAYDIDELLQSMDDEALYEDEDAANSLYARSILACAKVAPVIMGVMIGELANADPDVRVHAAMGAVALAKTEALSDHAADLESRLRTLAKESIDPDERSSYILALGDLDYEPVEYLDDPHPGVRMCAALAPKLASNPQAIEVLIHTLQHAGDVDNWFKERPPQFTLRPRFTVVYRLVHAVDQFERLVDVAIGLIPVTSVTLVDADWGLLLAKAFPDGDGVIKTDAQRRFLGELVKHKDFWDPHFGNPLKWFKQAGLPYDRKACESLLGSD